ncbi:carbon storage regulator CsrA [Sporomusa sphaeroides]|uniref:carbon storage regulator CsrA n=1 Tax=Sporomusa sphaeroides TaxID=47679 RepID=UPI003DA15F7C
MLALTRKVGERIIIDNNIILTIVDIKGDSIRLAIDAPKEVKIYRGELYDAIVAENRQSASPVFLPGKDLLQNIKLP